MKDLCPDCLSMHPKDTECPTITCGRCGEIMYHPAEAEGCRDWACPMQEDASVFKQNAKYHPQYHTTRAPWEKR